MLQVFLCQRHSFLHRKWLENKRKYDKLSYQHTIYYAHTEYRHTECIGLHSWVRCQPVSYPDCTMSEFDQFLFQNQLNQYNGSYQVISQSTGSCKSVIGYSSGIFWAFISCLHLSVSHEAFIRHSLGSHLSVIWQSSGSCRAVIRQLWGSQAVVRQSSSHHILVLDSLPKTKVLFVVAIWKEKRHSGLFLFYKL